MDLPHFGYDEGAQANFGAIEDAVHPDPMPATLTNSSSLWSVCDANAAPQPFPPAWPVVPEQQTVARANFGAIEDAVHPDLMPAISTNGSSLWSVCDANAAPQPFPPAWPVVPEQQTMFSYGPATYQPVPWVSEHRFEQPMNPFSYQCVDSLRIHMPPTSNPVDIPSHMSYQHGFVDHQSPAHTTDEFGDPNINQGWSRHGDLLPSDDMFGDDADEGAESADPCYAQLLYTCLKEAPGNTLPLCEVYQWVALHSRKAKDPSNRGWRNSVRHNLSMNAAFTRVHTGAGSLKNGSLWRLTEKALQEGVLSTTRYRKAPKRRPEHRAIPALSRQESGAKGGRATREATCLRQYQQQQRSYGLPPPPPYAEHRVMCSPHSDCSAPHPLVSQPHYIPYRSSHQPHSRPPSPHFDTEEDN